MADAFNALVAAIKSIWGLLAIGVGVAGIVWKATEKIEAGLTDDTKLTIGVWLLDRKKVGPRIQIWPDTFARVFDRVFGSKHLSWTCFWRSAVVSLALYSVTKLLVAPAYYGSFASVPSLTIGAFTNVIPDYISLLETRYSLRFMVNRKAVIVLAVLVFDLFFTAYIGASSTHAFNVSFQQLQNEDHRLYDTGSGGWVPMRINPWWQVYYGAKAFGERLVFPGNWFSADSYLPEKLFPFMHAFPGQQLPQGYSWMLLSIYIPSFFTSAWLWLYAGSGLLLRIALRYDTCFDWFNGHFDIAKKPLYSVGLVSGALFVVIWSVAVIAWKLL